MIQSSVCPPCLHSHLQPGRVEHLGRSWMQQVCWWLPLLGKDQGWKMQWWVRAEERQIHGLCPLCRWCNWVTTKLPTSSAGNRAHGLPSACQRCRCLAGLHACRGWGLGFQAMSLCLSCSNPQHHSLQGIRSNRVLRHRWHEEPGLLCPGKHFLTLRR